MIRKAKPAIIILFLYVFLFSAGFAFGETIAMHPFRSAPQDSQEVIQMAEILFDVMMRTLPDVPGGHVPYPIDLSRLPPDVPEGGFPPWVCPSPSVTMGAPYAITGEVSPDFDHPGSYRLRIYLWNMEDSRLLGSDEFTSEGRDDSSQTMPHFLQWILSWVTQAEQAPVVVHIEGGIGAVEYPAIEQNWLYLGVQGGGGYSIWAYAKDQQQAGDGMNEMASFMSMNLGLRASLGLFTFLRLRTELNCVMDTGSVEGRPLSSLFLQIPLIAQIVIPGGRMEPGIYGGVTMQFILDSTSDDMNRNFDYTPSFPGFIFGLNVGWKLGPGVLFLDSRFNYDGRWGSRDSYDEVYYRLSTRINIGYEWGFFTR